MRARLITAPRSTRLQLPLQQKRITQRASLRSSCIFYLSSRTPIGLRRPLFMPLPRPPLSLDPDTPLPTAMPLSDMRQDCQVNSGLLRLGTATADLVHQHETTDRLVQSLLERLGPPQAKNARFATQPPFRVSLMTPAPSPSLAHSAPFTAPAAVSVECLAPLSPFM